MGDETWNDRRGADDLRAENVELKAMVMNLTVRLRAEEERSAQRASLPPGIRDRGVWVSVAGGDAGTRQTLQLRAPIPDGVGDGMYAVYRGCVVGVVQNTGVAGAHVRLVTDVGFKVKCDFTRLGKNERGVLQMIPIASSTVVVEGAGDNTLRVSKTGMSRKDAEDAGLVDKNGKLAEGLWVCISKQDTEVPPVLHGYPVAQVEKIVPRADMPLFADVTLQPATNLMRLREVMVVTKE
jgi:cell shape-determining protein MreC